MFSLPNRKTLPALLTLLLLVLTIASCKNFFVDPKLTSLAITAAQSSVAAGKTVQLQAVGTYDDSSTKDLTSSVKWTPSPAGVLSIDANGLATGGAAGGTASITAKAGTLTSNTLTVVVGTLASITLTASPGTTVPASSTVTFTATGHYSPGGATNDITSGVTWLSSNTSVIATVSGGTATVLNAASGSTTTITATDPSTNVNGTITITVQ